ncbi:microsomal triglyceride transfer protein large subunit isoform X1 [Cephus cinctus]|uniref:Microsomal triglyceride transfer protein large subunit isoform X1 n=1 Tax=Cephus cinctus TaxID=211228 RepID=A0AAJ7RS53_CEPCN|nr:microsomal triglyceride transfer protein large subunit isoform X1 [Cephus cinctus]
MEIYLNPSEKLSGLNLKRGLASLFQYKNVDGEFQERDASGLCNVSYNLIRARFIKKQKIICQQNVYAQEKKHLIPIMGVAVTSSRMSMYELTQAFLPKSIIDYENHTINLRGKQNVGTIITSQRTLTLLPGTLDTSPVQTDTVKDAIALLEQSFRKIPIELQPEPVLCPHSGCITLEEILEQNREALEDAAMGSVKSASALLKLIPLVRDASPEELDKLLKSPRNTKFKSQLYDILGSAGTSVSHQTAMKILEQEKISDDIERYLRALSISTNPNTDIIKDILRRSKETMQNTKISETLALTAAAMARQGGSPTIRERVRGSLEIQLGNCLSDECKLKYLRALRNLRTKTIIPTLLNYAINETNLVSLTAWRALRYLPKEDLTHEVKIIAARIFYQILYPRRSISTRIAALDIILKADPSKKDLQGLIQYLATNDSAYEIRIYLVQRMEQIAENNVKFAKKLKEAFQSATMKILNYNVLSLKGFSRAFTRSFFKSAETNGSLITVQEASSGLLKRGIVDLILQSGENDQSLFSLELYRGGLGSFASSFKDNSDTPDEDEAVIAGMDISILGVDIRPFVLFSSQRELIGHIWSGTASKRTPVLQGLLNFPQHKQFIPMSSGFVIETEVNGAASLDLAGQVQLSLWSRKAQSLTNIRSGIAIIGSSRVHSNFIQSSVEFTLSMEPKLELTTDAQYSASVFLCMRLSQPKTTIRHNIYKIERIPGSKHKLRKTRRTELLLPAKSYFLDMKNNEMCSKLIQHN